MLHRLAYASRALIRAHSPEMLDIVRSSLRNNPSDRLTGALYFDDSQFFQVVEGPEAAIDALWSNLLTDPRHYDIAPLRREPVEGRLFGAWSMKFHDGALSGCSTVSFDYDRLRAATQDRLDEKIAALRLL